MKKSLLSRIFIFGTIFFFFILAAYMVKGHRGAIHALNLRSLPLGSFVALSASEAWTDYMFECEIRMRPSAFEALLAGRNFENDPRDFEIGRRTRAYRIPFYNSFEIAEVWRWSKGTDEYIDPFCNVYVNRERTRILLQYGTD